MSQLGISINLYLMDGVTNGRWEAALSNWNGTAYKIPRNALKECDDITELRTPGVYFLFGKDDDSEKQFVYVGEADDVARRIGQPHSFEKDGSYWSEAVIFVTRDGTLEKGRVKYLENRFHAIVSEAHRYILKNGATPAKAQLPKQIRDLLEGFIRNILLIMPTLGHRVFEPLAEKATCTNSNNINDKNDDDLLYFSRNKGKGGSASGWITGEGFVVFKGSYINPVVAGYVSSGINTARKKYAPVIGADGILKEDILFGSPSFAATFVCGKNTNGLTEWKNADGVSLKELSGSGETNAPAGVQPEPEEPKETGRNNELILSSKKVSARGQLHPSGFMVFKGSGYYPIDAPSSDRSIKKRRLKLLAEGIVKDGIFTEDTIFGSPSTAAACILGYNINGQTAWKDESGSTLKEMSKQ